MRVGIAGTGTLAEALGTGWARAGHEVVIAGRSPEKAAGLAGRLGARTVPLPEIGRDADAVLLAVPWDAVGEVLQIAGGGLAGTVVIDPTNPVRHAEGEVLLPPGRSMAEEIAEQVQAARVVKAFNVFPAAQWGSGSVTVVMCGDERAFEVAAALTRDLGGQPALLGPLTRARQLEEVAGFVIGLVFSGFDPQHAVPKLPGPAA